MLYLTEVRAEAIKVFKAKNDPVMAPRASSSGMVHPERAAALAAFCADWPDDPREPLTPKRSEDQIHEDLTTQLRAELAEANAVVLAAKRDAHEAYMAAG